MDPDPWKPKRRWGSAGYLVLIVVAILVAVFILRPLGQALTAPFWQITNALGGK